MFPNTGALNPVVHLVLQYNDEKAAVNIEGQVRDKIAKLFGGIPLRQQTADVVNQTQIFLKNKEDILDLGAAGIFLKSLDIDFTGSNQIGAITVELFDSSSFILESIFNAAIRLGQPQNSKLANFDLLNFNMSFGYTDLSSSEIQLNTIQKRQRDLLDDYSTRIGGEILSIDWPVAITEVNYNCQGDGVKYTLKGIAPLTPKLALSSLANVISGDGKGESTNFSISTEVGQTFQSTLLKAVAQSGAYIYLDEKIPARIKNYKFKEGQQNTFSGRTLMEVVKQIVDLMNSKQTQRFLQVRQEFSGKGKKMAAKQMIKFAENQSVELNRIIRDNSSVSTLQKQLETVNDHPSIKQDFETRQNNMAATNNFGGNAAVTNEKITETLKLDNEEAVSIAQKNYDAMKFWGDNYGVNSGGECAYWIDYAPNDADMLSIYNENWIDAYPFLGVYKYFDSPNFSSQDDDAGVNVLSVDANMDKWLLATKQSEATNLTNMFGVNDSYSDTAKAADKISKAVSAAVGSTSVPPQTKTSLLSAVKDVGNTFATAAQKSGVENAWIVAKDAIAKTGRAVMSADIQGAHKPYGIGSYEANEIPEAYNLDGKAVSNFKDYVQMMSALDYVTNMRKRFFLFNIEITVLGDVQMNQFLLYNSFLRLEYITQSGELHPVLSGLWRLCGFKHEISAGKFITKLSLMNPLQDSNFVGAA